MIRHSRPSMYRRNSCYARRARSERGAATITFSLIIILIVLAICSFAYDIAHNIAVRSQLQAAADAAATAGAYDLDLSGGNGDFTPTPAMATSYSAIARMDALSVTQKSYADGQLIQDSEVTTLPCQMSDPPVTPRSGYDQNYYMTVKIQKRIYNILAALYGHPTDTITVIAVGGPIGRIGSPTSVTNPFPLAVYQGNEGVGNRTWNMEAGLNNLNLGLLPMLTNNTQYQFISGPTGLLGGTMATVGLGGNGYPTVEMLKAFDPAQSTCYSPPTYCDGQTLMLMNPGITGLNLTALQAGPLTVEDYFQNGCLDNACFGLTVNPPSNFPRLASFLQNKTFIVPVVGNPNCSILSMPLGSILKGGISAQIKGYAQVRFTSSYSRLGTGISALGLTVLPPDFTVQATVSPVTVPANIGICQ